MTSPESAAVTREQCVKFLEGVMGIQTTYGALPMREAHNYFDCCPREIWASLLAHLSAAPPAQPTLREGIDELREFTRTLPQPDIGPDCQPAAALSDSDKDAIALCTYVEHFASHSSECASRIPYQPPRGFHKRDCDCALRLAKENARALAKRLSGSTHG